MLERTNSRDAPDAGVIPPTPGTAGPLAAGLAHERAPGKRTIGLAVLWGACVIMGMLALIRHSHSAGTPAAGPPPVWPANSPLARSAQTYQLVMFVHPRCPCSQASISELARLMADFRSRVDVQVVFFRPSNEPDEWVRTWLWLRAAAIPGVTTSIDPGGKLANRFGATTSGLVLLYDPSGRLAFQGGITPSRGHEGDNLGRASIVALVEHRSARASCPVFGCALDDPSELPAPLPVSSH